MADWVWFYCLPPEFFPSQMLGKQQQSSSPHLSCQRLDSVEVRQRLQAGPPRMETSVSRLHCVMEEVALGENAGCTVTKTPAHTGSETVRLARQGYFGSTLGEL